MSGSPSTADTPPTLRLLGAPALVRAEGTVHFAADRPYQLLAFLACRGGWVGRDELASLLFPGRSLDVARSNLRAVLLRARRVPGVGSIETHGELLRWLPDSDLQRFERACDGGRFADALVLYGGPLLQGLDSGWPPEAAEWLTGERSRLEGRWHDAALARLRQLREDPVATEALAQVLLRHDPLDDEAMHALLDAQARQGRRGDALAALQGYAQQLSASLGLEPSAALQGLASALRGEGRAPSTEASAAPAPPAAAASAPEPAPVRNVEPVDFVGRREELAVVEARLVGGEARLLTLLGPSGIGKTALARAALARLQPRFAAGAAWVGLEGVQATDQVPARIALALGLAPATKLEPWAALERALSEAARGPRLVVLDNLEQLLPHDGAAGGDAPAASGPAPAEPGTALPARLQALLHAAPGLRVLATSRSALGLPEEWRLPLDGLPLPDADETDAEVLRANDAVRLFELRALPLAPAFRLADEAVDVVRIVREVEGLPLAIGLLAAWRRLMPVREIVAELRDSLELLEPTTPGERSVRAAFERSWRQLSPLQQRLLGQLALLPQPVDREMLRAVLHAPLPLVASLVDRSLVQADGHGHFTLHALIRRQAAPHASDAPHLLARHAHHVSRRLHALSRPAQLALLDAQIEHVRAAWAWALGRPEPTVLAALGPLFVLHDSERGPLGGALPALREAVALLETRLAREDAAGPSAQALAATLGEISDLEFRLGNLHGAEQAARRALALVDAGLHDPLRQTDALMTLYSVHWQRGELAEAGAIVPRYREAARAAGSRQREASSYTLAGLTDSALGRYDSALEHYLTARRLLEELGETASLPTVLNNTGSLLRKMKRHAEAIRTLEEGLQWARQHGAAGARPALLANLAVVHEETGDHAAMLRTTERALEAARVVTEPYTLMRALLAHGRALARRDGDLATALAPAWQALRLAERMRTGWERHQCLISAARTAALCGRRSEGAAVLRWVARQPGLPPDTQALVRDALAEAADAAAPEAHAQAPAVVWADNALVEDVLASLAPEATGGTN